MSLGEAEKALEALALSEADAFKSETLRTAHECLYQRLAIEDRQSDDGQEVVPGRWRDVQVAVYRHEPPPVAAIALFLARTDTAYGIGHRLETLLTVAACAHHRLAWVHPFLDGNRRAIRLQRYAGLHALTDGLWSANRGLARQRDRYHQCLSEVDMARQGDLDGRGNLSERMLVRWCGFLQERTAHRHPAGHLEHPVPEPASRSSGGFAGMTPWCGGCAGTGI